MAFPRPNPNNRDAPVYAVVIWVVIILAVVANLVHC